MILDYLERFKQLDTQNMLAEIDGLPAQLQQAWELGQSLPLHEMEIRNFTRVIITGMGGSAIGGDLLAAWAASQASIPVVVNRDYGLPAFAHGAETLVIASSHSGNTEETLDAFATAFENGCTSIAITTGGALAKTAAANDATTWIFKHEGSRGRPLDSRLGCCWPCSRGEANSGPKPGAGRGAAGDAQTAEQAARRRTRRENPAKRYAGQLIGRWATILAPATWHRSRPGSRRRSMKSPKPWRASSSAGSGSQRIGRNAASRGSAYATQHEPVRALALRRSGQSAASRPDQEGVHAGRPEHRLPGCSRAQPSG